MPSFSVMERSDILPFSCPIAKMLLFLLFDLVGFHEAHMIFFSSLQQMRGCSVMHASYTKKFPHEASTIHNL